jgi:predicted O-linked N-acetylglucosamine transferase (SPINDLY family)
MGADHIDYIIADATVIPNESQNHYTEKVAYLPDCYLPPHGGRAISERTPTRTAAGLPETGFVFASFNNAYKFSPQMFAIWMRLLSAVGNSVLWLRNTHPAAMRNLRRTAELRGVDGARLIFASPIPAPEDHLARLRLADLFLDTLPYNAHSTAVDALCAGLPVLALRGASFAGRVAASLLATLKIPELIADSEEAYEAKALALARDAKALGALKTKLALRRMETPLFDTARFTRHLESAYAAMWERHQRGLPPASFAVATISDTTRPAPIDSTARRNGASVTPDIGASTTRFDTGTEPMLNEGTEFSVRLLLLPSVTLGLGPYAYILSYFRTAYRLANYHRGASAAMQHN